ncbi:MAG: cysteine hydrolase [Clostridiales bacterium]|jgi:nicotinamidase-related amidase|nr:cysteine hydrolase [Clostridiales bacterium]
MQNKALIVIDIQNDITKNYKEIIGTINSAVDWAVAHDVPVVYMRHFNLSAGTRNFKPDTPGAELASDLKIVSEHIFDKSKTNVLTSAPFASYLSENGISELFITGADAAICIKSTCFNLRKAGYEVTVLSDCITSWDKKKLPEMISYYEKQGCKVCALADL